MKKRIFLSLICGVLLIGLITGCGNDTNTNSNNSTTNNNNEATQNNESARYDKTFDFYGYTVAYASDCTMSVRTGGYTVTRNSDFWIVYSTPSLFGEEFTVEGLDGIADKCSNSVIQSVQPLQQFFDGTAYTKVNVENETIKTINGNKMLRVEGTFINTSKNTTVEYIGYYLTTDVGGSEYPVYIIGIPLNARFDVLAKYIDESVNYISK